MTNPAPVAQIPPQPVKRKYIGSGEDVPVGDELNDLIEAILEEDYVVHHH